jgi:hypothetical protein
MIVKTATKRRRSLGQPFTRWTVRKLVKYLRTKEGHKITISREHLRQLLAEEGVTFQATKTGRNHPTRSASRSWHASSTCSSMSGARTLLMPGRRLDAVSQTRASHGVLPTTQGRLDSSMR